MEVPSNPNGPRLVPPAPQIDPKYLWMAGADLYKQVEAQIMSRTPRGRADPTAKTPDDKMEGPMGGREDEGDTPRAMTKLTDSMTPRDRRGPIKDEEISSNIKQGREPGDELKALDDMFKLINATMPGARGRTPSEDNYVRRGTSTSIIRPPADYATATPDMLGTLDMGGRTPR